MGAVVAVHISSLSACVGAAIELTSSLTYHVHDSEQERLKRSNAGHRGVADDVTTPPRALDLHTLIAASNQLERPFLCVDAYVVDQC